MRGSISLAIAALLASACTTVPQGNAGGAGGASSSASTSGSVGSTASSTTSTSSAEAASGSSTSSSDASSSSASTGSGGGPPLLTLATGQNNPRDIAVVNGNVYWTNTGSDGLGVNGYNTDGAVMTVKADGSGTAQPLVVNPGLSPLGIAADANGVYWKANANGQYSYAIYQVPLTGGSGTVLSDGDYDVGAYPWGEIAIDTTTVYFFAYNHDVRKIAHDNIPHGHETAPKIADNYNKGGVGIASDGINVYFSDQGTNTIVRAGVGSTGASTDFETGQPTCWGVALDTTTVYWSNKGNGTIKKERKDKVGGVMELAAGLSGPGYIAIDDTHVYWASDGPSQQEGTIQRVSLTGGMIDTLATGLDRPSGIALDTNAVYWVNRGGTVMRALK